MKAEKRKKSAAAFYLIMFFVLAAFAVFCKEYVRPLLTALQARNWSDSLCTVVSTEIAPRHDTNKIYIEYKYLFDGAEYTSDVIDFYQRKTLHQFHSRKEMIDAFKPGSKFRCYVNPLNPAEAVIYKNYPPILAALPPLIFMLMGFVVLKGVANSNIETTSLPPADKFSYADHDQKVINENKDLLLAFFDKYMIASFHLFSYAASFYTFSIMQPLVEKYSGSSPTAALTASNLMDLTIIIYTYFAMKIAEARTRSRYKAPFISETEAKELGRVDKDVLVLTDKQYSFRTNAEILIYTFVRFTLFNFFILGGLTSGGLLKGGAYLLLGIFGSILSVAFTLVGTALITAYDSKTGKRSVIVQGIGALLLLPPASFVLFAIYKYFT